MGDIQLLGPNELVTNPFFETDLTDWSLFVNAGSATLQRDTTVPYEGTYVAHVYWGITSGGADQIQLLHRTNSLPVTKDVTYLLRFAVREGGAVLRYMPTMIYPFTSDVNTVTLTTSEWTRLGMYFTPPSDTNSAAIRFDINDNGQPIRFDSVSLLPCVTLNAGYDSEFKEVLPRVDNRTITGALKTYIGAGDYSQWRYPMSWINSLDRSLVNSWWKSGATLSLVEDSTYPDSLTLVRIMGVEEPFQSFVLPYQGTYYEGEVILESI